MTRDDIIFLIERAIGLWLIVIGLDWLPQLIEKWMGGFGSEDTSARETALQTFVPLAAGAFLLLRKHPPASVPAAQPPASAMSRTDWLWVGCKLLGAYWLVLGVGNLATAALWPTDLSPGRLSTRLPMLLGPVIWVVGGAVLFFGNVLWRLACRTAPTGP